jgi:hypothetical protein
VFKMNSQSAEMLGTGMETLANSIETFKTSAITQQTAPLI